MRFFQKINFAAFPLNFEDRNAEKMSFSVKKTFQRQAESFYCIISIQMKTPLVAAFLASFATAKYHKEYQYEPLQIRDFNSADLDSLFRSDGRFKSAKRAEFGAIRQAQSDILTPTRTIDSLFLRLPSSTQLDELVISADSVAILKTIQTVATDDSIPCDQRIAYLLEVLGRIRCAIEKKQFAAESLEVIINGALEEIKRLQGEIARLEDEKNALWLDELRDKLADLVDQLEEVYRKFNHTEESIAPKEARVAGFEKQIQILRKSSDKERNRIAQDRLKLTKTEAIIRDLQNELQQALHRKAALEVSIKRSEDAIAENDARVEEAREEIRKLEEKIADLQQQADLLRGKYTDLEIKVERLRNDISVAEAKQDKLNAEIDQNINRINFEKKKIAQDELDDLNRMIAILKELVPTVESEIDRHYYYCYGEGSVEVEKTGDVTVYIVRGESFGDYLQNAYGKSVKVPALRGDVHFEKVDIFGAPWTNKYGFPFVDTSLEGRDLAFGGDFSCIESASLEKGYGTIERIDGKHIYCNNDDGRKLKFNLGACTRLEGTYQVPKVGQNFYWSATPSSADGYNLIAGSCV